MGDHTRLAEQVAVPAEARLYGQRLASGGGTGITFGGSGYYLRFYAKQIGPSGRVFAVEVQPEMLDILKKQTAEMGI